MARDGGETPRRGQFGDREQRDALRERVLARMPSPEARRRAARAFEEAAEGREERDIADFRLRRGIAALHDAGVPQRDIADAVGIPQPEVSRRLRRRELHPGARGPREVIMERKFGTIDGAEMIRQLVAMRLTAKSPGRRGAHDAAASATGTARQLMAALREGLISEEEYEAVRAAVARRFDR